MKILIAVTGASGTLYAERLLKSLVNYRLERLDVSVIVSEQGRRVAQWEHCSHVLAHDSVTYYDNRDFFTPPASGSNAPDAMVVIPCSMGMLGKIAGGISDDLISRSADVMLKERRRLILVTRETPLSLIHLRNMTTVTESGGIICPASPSFYGGATSVEELCDTVVQRVMTLIGLESSLRGWQA